EARDAADWTATAAGLEQALRVWRLAAGAGPTRRDAPQLRADRAQREALLALLGVLDGIVDVLKAAAPRSRDLLRLAHRGAELRRRLSEWLSRLEGSEKRVDAEREQNNGADAKVGNVDADVQAAGVSAGVRVGVSPD